MANAGEQPFDRFGFPIIGSLYGKNDCVVAGSNGPYMEIGDMKIGFGLNGGADFFEKPGLNTAIEQN